MSGKEDYVRKMHSKLDHWNHDLDALIARKGEIAESARAEYTKHVEELRQRRDEYQVKLKTLQEAGDSAWEDMKAGLEMAWDAISQAIESARSRFK